MKTKIINNGDAWCIAFALRIAAERYSENAKICATGGEDGPALARLEEQFEHQAKIALKFADIFESAIEDIEVVVSEDDNE